MSAGSPCYLCRRSTPRQTLVRQYVMKGFDGRRKSGHVLMCVSRAGGPRYSGRSSAPVHGPTGGQTQHDYKKTVAIIGLVPMTVAAVLVGLSEVIRH
jgi:hypothetical protein